MADGTLFGALQAPRRVRDGGLVIDISTPLLRLVRQGRLDRRPMPTRTRRRIFAYTATEPR